MHLHNKSVGRFQRLVSSPLNVPCSGCRPRRVVKAKALGISSNASFTLRAENLPSFGGGPSFEGVFSKQIEPLQGIVENMKGLDDIVSQVGNGSLEVISRSFEIFDVFPGHFVLNALVTLFFFLCLYIFVILVPRQ